MKYVIDCSFSSALFLPDENSQRSRDFFLSLSRKDRVYVPLLWWYESVNVLRISVKRKRLKHKEVSAIIELLGNLNFITDIESGKLFAKDLFEMSEKYDITSYDAAYLILASRENAKLMTFDDGLNKAAELFGIN